MIPPEIVELSQTVREVLAEHGPLTTPDLHRYLPDRRRDEVVRAVRALKHTDRIRRCAARSGFTVWALADRPARPPPSVPSPGRIRARSRPKAGVGRQKKEKE